LEVVRERKEEMKKNGRCRGPFIVEEKEHFVYRVFSDIKGIAEVSPKMSMKVTSSHLLLAVLTLSSSHHQMLDRRSQSHKDHTLS
jgi:hypothetical protein